MVELKTYDISGKEAGSAKVSDAIFAQKRNEAIVHSALVWYLACRRRGTHSTKTRAEVRGGGVKPWKQKGTGRARAGSIRSPLWNGGGVIFGPKPRSYAYTMPKKARKLALKVVLSDKARENKLMVVDKLELKEPKTKKVVALLKSLKIKDQKTLLVIDDKNENVLKAARNIAGVVVSKGKEINVHDLLNCAVVVISKAGLAQVEEVLKS